MDLLQREPRNFRPNRGGVRKKLLFGVQNFNVSETRQDRTEVAIEYQVPNALSNGAKISDLGWP